MNIVINHFLIRTSDLKEMIHFFENILGLHQGNRPAFGFPGAWLYSDKKPLIHLSENSSSDNLADKKQADYLGRSHNSTHFSTGIIDHIAFSGVDYSDLKDRLKQYKMKYFERSIPLTGEHQVFVDGPEGLRVEIQFESFDNDQ
jgi:lactoylglutathione lyase